MLAAPSTVFQLFIDKLTQTDPDGALLSTHAWTSIKEAGIGYVLALLIGIPMGLLMGWFTTVRGLFRPIFEMIRPIPPVAWIPLCIFWFGIGLSGKVFIIWIGAVVPCVINAWVGVNMTNPTLIQMARTYGATRHADIYQALHSVRSSYGIRGVADCLGLRLDESGCG